MLDQRVDDRLRIFAANLDQHRIAGMALDQGRNLAVLAAEQQVAFPVPWRALGRVARLSHALNDPPPPRARSLPVRPGSAPIGNGGVRPDGSRRSPPEYLVSTSGSDQTTGRR